MSKKQSALLYSLLFWPGAGHVYLGRKKKGYFFIVLAVVLLSALFLVFEIELIRQMRLLTHPSQALSHTRELLGHVWQARKMEFVVCLLGLLGVWTYAAADIVLMKK